MHWELVSSESYLSRVCGSRRIDTCIVYSMCYSMCYSMLYYVILY